MCVGLGGVAVSSWPHAAREATKTRRRHPGARSATSDADEPLAPTRREAALLILSLGLAPSAATAAPPATMRYSAFLDALDAGAVSAVTVSPDGSALAVTLASGARALVVLPPPPPPALGGDPGLLGRLAAAGVAVKGLPAGAAAPSAANADADAAHPLDPPSTPSSRLGAGVLAAGLAACLYFIMRRRPGGGGASDDTPPALPPGSGGGLLGSRFSPNDPLAGPLAMLRAAVKPAKSDVTFADVAGVEGAKTELREVVDFLRNPAKYAALGARLPRGVLLEGPPGTGKTLLARAVAGEAGVPFFSAAGPEFVEVFVGVGAARVRDLFAAARSAAPAIMLIDEIDAVGRVRGAGLGGGNDEREQTLNQLLTEMDGFEDRAAGGGPPPPLIVLAATNRPDVLDPALLRPGRFDRRVTLDLPDLAGRTAILRVHARRKALAPGVDLAALAARTPGFSGAGLANVLNEAAIGAARAGRPAINPDDVEQAVERVIAGPARTSAVLTPARRHAAAVHEAGHAVVAALIHDYDAIARVSIIPRAGRSSQSAGGFGSTWFAPDEAAAVAGLPSRSRLEAGMTVALGGRAAEALVLGDTAVTTGAADDCVAVARIARAMIEACGFAADRLGPLVWSAPPGPPGAAVAAPALDHSEATGDAIDAAVAAEVAAAYGRAERLLKDNRPFLDAVIAALEERESLDGVELEELRALAGGLAEDPPAPPTSAGLAVERHQG